MNNIKKIIIILIILLVVIGITVIALTSLNGNNGTQSGENTSGETETATELGFAQVSDYNTYYKIKGIMDQYIMYIKQLNGDEYVDATKAGLTASEVNEQLLQEGQLSMTNVIDSQYLTDIGTDINHAIEMVNQYQVNGNYQESVDYDLSINNLATSSSDNNITLALLTSTLNNKEFNLLIKMDLTNNTYSIFLSDYLEQFGYNENTTKDNININTNSIEQNDYNLINDVTVDDEYIVKQYFSDYRSKMLNNPEVAYNLLNEEYRNNKFGSYENFVTYIENNRLDIELAGIEGYQVNENNGEREYICIDQNNKYYIFTEESVYNYNAILDTYTVDLPEFLTQYNDSNNAEKAGMNIQKVVDAINDGDYRYIYNKLDETFKQTNFPTEADFQNYINTNLYSDNNTTFSNYRSSGDLHIFDVTFTDNNNAGSQSITKTFIVQLTEETGFVMSFNV